MIIAVASGKGGTGKTTVAVSLALSIPGTVTLLDCDVEEPNAGIFLKVDNSKEQPITVPVPSIDTSRCTVCGKCARFCEFNAIVCIGTAAMVFPELCHSCGGCIRICPQKAMTETPVAIGTLTEATATRENSDTRSAKSSESPPIHFVQGLLSTGNALTPPVIRAVRARGKQMRGKDSQGEAVTIIDSPPGTSCPMTTAVRGTDFVLLVTEPTPFGLHDLKLAVETVRKMRLPFGVVLNRADSGDNRVTEFCKREGIEILLQIPEDRRIAEAYSSGHALVNAFPEYGERFRHLYEAVIFRKDHALASIEQKAENCE